MTDHEDRAGSHDAGDGVQHPPVRPPIPPVPPQGSVRPPIPPVPPQDWVPPQRSNKPVWIGLLLFAGALLIIGAVLALAFISTDSGGTSSSTGTKEEASSDETILVQSEDSELQLQVPDSWEELKGMNPAASIGVGNKFDENYAIVISDSMEDFGNPPALEDFATVQLRLFTKRLGSVKVSEAVAVADYDPPAIRYEVRARIDKLDVAYMVTFLRTEKRFAQIITWTLASRWEDNRGILERVSNSLQELETG